jgi:anti-sigma factor RsiW
MISVLDNHLLRAYLAGEMDEAAAEAFEILMIERPELAELVDADTALQMGLAGASAGPVSLPTAVPASMLASSTTTASDNIVPLTRPERTRAPHWVPLLAAAGVLLAVGIGIGRLGMPEPAALVPTTLLSVDRLRSTADDVPKLRLPADGQIVLSVPVVARADCAPQVRIVQSGITLQASVKPDDYGFANLGIAATRFAPGKADVSVACNGKELARYPIEFVR